MSVEIKARSMPLRLIELDALRGLLMALMALDHANYFVAQRHSSGEYWGGPLPVYANSAAFLVRWITHFAPAGFALLLGIGAALFAQSRRAQGWSTWRITGLLALRGSLLVLLQLLVVNRAWELSPGGWGVPVYLGILYALGAGLFIASLLVHAPPWVNGMLALLLPIILQWRLPGPEQWGLTLAAWQHQLYLPGGAYPIWVNYPILPWLAFIAAGLWFGQRLAKDPARTRREVLWIGLGCLLAFGLVRALNGWGNQQTPVVDSWQAFLTVTKYPPSIAYQLLTIGGNLLLWVLAAWVADRTPRALAFLAGLGRAPLCFYVLHLFLYAGLGHALTPSGSSLGVMLLIWLLGLAMLYPICLWYRDIKSRQSLNSLARLF